MQWRPALENPETLILWICLICEKGTLMNKKYQLVTSCAVLQSKLNSSKLALNSQT
jgi:hypothetical protein